MPNGKNCRLRRLPEFGRSDLYSYDSTDQVTGVTYGSGRVVGYQYDPLGNLTQKVDNGTADNYTANSL